MVKSKLSIDTLILESQRGEFDSLRAIIEDLKNVAFESFTKRLNMCGIGRGRPIKSLIVHTYIFSVLDSMSWRLKLSPEKIARELYRLTRNIGDVDHELDVYIQEELVDSAIEYTDFLSKLKDRQREKFVHSICTLSSAILETKEQRDYKYLLELSKRLVNVLVRELNDKLFQERSYAIGRLVILSKRTNSMRDLAELVRTMILSLPCSNQRISNLFAFYFIRILGILQKTTPYLHVPIDPYLSLVVNRLGLLKYELSSSLSYLSKTYRMVQKAFKIIQPNDTISLYSLRYVQETTCNIRTPKCYTCPLMPCCNQHDRML